MHPPSGQAANLNSWSCSPLGVLCPRPPYQSLWASLSVLPEVGYRVRTGQQGSVASMGPTSGRVEYDEMGASSVRGWVG